MRLSKILFVILYVMAILAGCATQHEHSREQAQKLMQDAKLQAKAGDWKKVDAIYQEALQQCPGGDAGKACRPLVNYTYAYLKERQAGVQTDQRKALLQTAVTAYEKVLQDVPNHGPSLNNLAVIYHNMGDSERAIALLHKAMSSDAQRKRQYGMVLADIYRSQQRWGDALDIYNGIAEQSTTIGELARTNIIVTYAQMPDERIAELTSSYIPKWREQFPDATAKALLLVMKKNATTDPRQAEQALISWVLLLAQIRAITLERIEQLPMQWPSTAIDDLRTYVTHPQSPPLYPNWWLKRIFRSHVLAQVALALGHQALAQQQEQEAERVWQVGREFAPQFEDYRAPELRDRPLIRLELQTELAGLYYNYPHLDNEKNDKFQSVIIDLFAGKAQAYKYADLPTIQRHHTVLGMIYVSRPDLENGKFPAMNAAFQLSHVLKVANQRNRTEGLYQALPNTKKALAMVCSSKHAGSRWCKDKDGHSKVPQLYLDAAAAYLDSDQLNDAQMMLVEADSADSSVKNSSQFASLQQIIDTRLFIASKSIAKPAQEMLPLENDPDHQWIYKGSLAGLDKNFIQRQQFKALSDLALKVKSLKHPGTAKSIQDRIIATIPKKVIIEKPDTADRLRLEKLFPMS